MSKIIQNSQDLLMIFLTMTITLTIVGILIYGFVIGKIVLSNDMVGLLVGAIATVGFVAIIRSIFGKTSTNGIVPNGTS